MKERLLVQRLLAVFAVGAVLFGFPLAGLFGRSALVMFGVWAAVIAVVAWLMERPAPEDE
jgi:hypothetical protein